MTASTVQYPLSPHPRYPNGAAFPPSWSRTVARWLVMACLLARLPDGVMAAEAMPDEFSALVKLAPFVVQGKQLSISVHARSGWDRKYAQEFAEEVVKVACEAVTPETGKGLVIIGAKGEPHPIVFFKKFLALAEAGKLDPAIAARAPELNTLLDHWRDHVNDDHKGGATPGNKEDLEFERIVTALPLPLEGIGARLYQLAWSEKFDDARVEARLRGLRPGGLERDYFAHFDWVFYLPPRYAFDQVLDELVADALKEDHTGFFARLAVKGVMLAVKPKIRRAIEAVRQGLLFQTVVQARTKLTESEISALTGAYIEARFPDLDEKRKPEGGTEHERAVNAVRAELRQLQGAPGAAATEPVRPDAPAMVPARVK